MYNKFVLRKDMLRMRKFWNVSSLLGVLFVLVSFSHFSFSQDNVSPCVGQSGLYDNSSKIRPKLEANVRLYKIFCESSKRSDRVQGCQEIFQLIIHSLHSYGVQCSNEMSKEDQKMSLENTIRSYKRLYKMID